MAEIRCTASLAASLAHYLSGRRWRVSCKDAPDRLIILEIRPDGYSDRNLDRWLVKLQQDTDEFLSTVFVTSEDEPEWQVRRCRQSGHCGYTDWEVEQKGECICNGDSPLSLLEEAGIRLETGWAFGNGTHPATAGSVDALIHLAGSKGFPDRTKVLDIGTGTGILAISAAVMGASNIIALDIEPESAKIATLNVRQNRMEDRIKVCQCPLHDLPNFQADVITANLTPSVMRGIFSEMIMFTGKETRVVASGFMQGMQHDMDRLFSKAKCVPEWQKSTAGWLTVIYRKIRNEDR